jgi:hypothetical protein
MILFLQVFIDIVFAIAITKNLFITGDGTPALLFDTVFAPHSSNSPPSASCSYNVSALAFENAPSSNASLAITYRDWPYFINDLTPPNLCEFALANNFTKTFPVTNVLSTIQTTGSWQIRIVNVAHAHIWFFGLVDCTGARGFIGHIKATTMFATF